MMKFFFELLSWNKFLFVIARKRIMVWNMLTQRTEFPSKSLFFKKSFIYIMALHLEMNPTVEMTLNSGMTK